MTDSPTRTIFYLCVNHKKRAIGGVQSIDFSKTYISQFAQAIAEQRQEVRSRVGELMIWTIKDKDVAILPSRLLANRLSKFSFSEESQEVKLHDPEEEVETLGLENKEKVLVYVPDEHRDEDEEPQNRPTKPPTVTQESIDEVEEGKDVLPELENYPAMQQRRNRLLIVNKETISVTSASDVENANKYVFTGRDDSRLAHPVALFMPPFAILQHVLENADSKGKEAVANSANKTFINHANDLSKYIRRYHSSEDALWAKIAPYFKAIFEGHPIEYEKYSNSKEKDGKVINKVVKGSNRADVVWGGNIVCLELKTEFGLSGDASLQAAIWFKKRCASLTFLKSSKIPCILIGVMGNLIEISIAVCLEELVVDNIFSFRIRKDCREEETIEKLTLLASALKTCADQLHTLFRGVPPASSNAESETWHLPCPTVMPSSGTQIITSPYIHCVSPTVSSPDIPTLIPPYICVVSSDALTSPDTSMPRLHFTAKLSRHNEPLVVKMSSEMRSLFVAKYVPPGSSQVIETVVKFTSKYNADAHHLLAEHNYAPKLYACVPVVGGLQMVVMGRVIGKRILDECVGDDSSAARPTLPRSFFEELEKAITILHDADTVFGDLRNGNIMVTKDPNGLSRPVLIDFDWAGKDTVKLYPSNFNEELNVEQLAPEVRRSVRMRKKHDKFALAHLIEKYCGGDEDYRRDQARALRSAGDYIG